MAQTVEDTLLVRMEASLRKFERQMEAGRKAAEKAAVGSERAWQRGGEKIAANANQAATGLQRITNVSGRGRFVIQNTANQIGDMAVQIGGGTSAMKAMGQQMPQLLGGFGALGGTLGVLGPLLGTVAALGLPIAAAFLMAGKEAESFNDRLKELRESIAAVKSAQELNSISTADLVSDYGRLADEAKAIFEINRKIASIRAQEALDSVARGIADELGVAGVFGFDPQEIREVEETIARIQGKIDSLNRPSEMTDTQLAGAVREIKELEDALSRLGSVRGNIDEIGDAFSVSEDAAREIVAQFAAIGQEQGPRDQAQAMLDLADYIYGASNNLSDASDEGEELYKQLLDAAIQGLELSKIDYASNLSAGADEAARLADNLLDALNRQNALAAGYSVGEPDQNGNVYSGRGRGPTAVERTQMRFGYVAPPEKASRSRRGGGGGGSKIDPRTREAARIFEETRTAAEKYAAELENLNQLREAGFITEDTHMRAVQKLGEKLNETGKLGEQMGRTITDALSQMVMDFDNARDAAANLLDALARMTLNAAFTPVGNWLGSFFPSANGNVIQNGRVTPFANGGVVNSPTLFPMRGGTGLMGEAGPEAIMPLTRAANGKLGVQAQGGGQVTVSLNLSEDMNARIENTSQNVAVKVMQQGIASYDRNRLPHSVRRISRDPRKVS